jgi:hypothetical protein
MCAILECRRDETGQPFPPEVCEACAEELHHAATKKDADMYIKIFANLSYPQFESLNKAYVGDLSADLRKFSGDFFELLLARCSNKYDYLSYRLSLDKEHAIPRYRLLILLFEYYSHVILVIGKNSRVPVSKRG